MAHAIPHARALYPAFSTEKLARNGDILFPDLSDSDETAFLPYVSWNNKGKNKLTWRGTPVGSCYSQRNGDWRQSHRLRLHIQAHKTNQHGSAQITVRQGKSAPWTPVTYGLGELNEAYTDISVVTGDHCVSSRPSCLLCHERKLISCGCSVMSKTVPALRSNARSALPLQSTRRGCRIPSVSSNAELHQTKTSTNPFAGTVILDRKRVLVHVDEIKLTRSWYILSGWRRPF